MENLENRESKLAECVVRDLSAFESFLFLLPFDFLFGVLSLCKICLGDVLD